MSADHLSSALHLPEHDRHVTGNLLLSELGSLKRAALQANTAFMLEVAEQIRDLLFDTLQAPLPETSHCWPVQQTSEVSWFDFAVAILTW